MVSFLSCCDVKESPTRARMFLSSEGYSRPSDSCYATRHRGFHRRVEKFHTDIQSATFREESQRVNPL
jgi:hypothetical protein